ncbi:MAG: hypothetical protein WCB96_01375 [Candidatus Aminicenantales bacterium]
MISRVNWKTRKPRSAARKQRGKRTRKTNIFLRVSGSGARLFAQEIFFPHIIKREEEQRRSGSVQGILKLRTPLSRSGVRAQDSRIELKIILVLVVVGQVQVVVGQQAFSQNQVMRLVAGDRLGRKNLSRSQKSIEPEKKE